MLKNGVGVYRSRVADEKLIYVSDHWMPVIRKRIGWAIYYRWNWWGILDWKIKTVWRKQYKDFELK